MGASHGTAGWACKGKPQVKRLTWRGAGAPDGASIARSSEPSKVGVEIYAQKASATPALQPPDGLGLHRRRQDSTLSKCRKASGIRARASRSAHNGNRKRRACAKEGRRGWHAHCEIVLSAPDEEGCRKPEERSRRISRPCLLPRRQRTRSAQTCGNVGVPMSDMCGAANPIHAQLHHGWE